MKESERIYRDVFCNRIEKARAWIVTSYGIVRKFGIEKET